MRLTCRCKVRLPPRKGSPKIPELLKALLVRNPKQRPPADRVCKALWKTCREETSAAASEAYHALPQTPAKEKERERHHSVEASSAAPRSAGSLPPMLPSSPPSRSQSLSLASQSQASSSICTNIKELSQQPQQLSGELRKGKAGAEEAQNEAPAQAENGEGRQPQRPEGKGPAGTWRLGRSQQRS